MNIDTLLAAARFLDWQEQQSRPDKFEKAGKLVLGKDVDARTVAGFGDERLPQVYTVVLPPLVCSTPPASLPGAALTLPTKPPERLEAELEAAAQAMPLAPSRDHHGDRSPAGITRAGADSENIDPRSRNLSPSRAPDPSLAIPAQELRTTSVPALLRPRSPPTSDAFPGLVENRADEPSSTDQRRRPGGAGTREVHNKLKKTRRTPDPLALALASRRRAYLKECFEALKKSIPNIEEKKTSNLTILRGALRYVQVLKRKEREFEHELDRLARHKIALQRHLLELCTGLPSQMDAQRLEKLLHQPTSPNDHDDATSTASEGEDNIDEELENSSFTMPHPSSHQWVQNTSDATKHGTQQLLTPDASGQTMNNFATVAAPSQNYPGPIQHTSFLSMSQTSAGHGVSQNALLEQTNMALHRELTPNSSTPSVMNKSAAELSVREARLSPSQITTPQVHKPVLPHPPSHIPPGMTRVIAAAMPCLVVQDSSQNVSIQSLGNSIVAKPPTHNATMQAASQPSPMQRLIAAAPCLVVQDQPNATGSPQNSSGHEIVAAVAPVSRKQPAGQTSVIQSAMGYVGRTLTNPSPCCLPAAIPHIGAPPISTTALPRPFPSCRMSVAPVIISRSASATAPPPGTQISVGKPVALGSVIPTPILIQVTKAAPVIGTPLAIGQATAAPSVLGPSPVLIGCSPSLGTAPSTKNTISVLSTPSVTAPGRAAVLIRQQPRYLEPQTASGLAIPGGGATFVLPGHLSEELPPVATPSAL